MSDFDRGPVTVRVPATSANLGPGFDCLGLALSMYDEVSAQVVSGDTVVTVEGEGAGVLPSDGSHLVAASFVTVFRELGVAAPSVRLHCRNTIPQARGLGSSSAAIVAGVLLAAELLGRDTVDRSGLLRIASKIEGHPDNVAPCLLGGFTIAWGDPAAVRAVSMDPVPDLPVVVYVPAGHSLTAAARAALPAQVSHADASFNVARAALAVHAFTRDAGLLFEASADRLHQRFRASAMPETAALVDRLRRAGVAAMVSGAGPSVLAFTDTPPRVPGFVLHQLAVAAGACRVG